MKHESTLDERRATVLRAVVEGYIETAQPVGSGHVARRPGVSVSPATVRNDMAALEQEGFLVQPHTSAGRIPTDKGYRFFVDSLVPSSNVDPTARHKISNFFAQAHGALEEMLHDTSRLLSDLTEYAAVVVGPPHEEATIRSVQIVSMNARTAMVVAVLSNGVIEKAVLELADDLADEFLAKASDALAAHLIGRPLADISPPPGTGDEVLDRLCSNALSAIESGHEHELDQVFVGGASRMATAFDAVETVRSVLSTLEQQYVVVTLLRDVIDQGLTVSIGAEHGHQPLAECSIVVAPYRVEGQVAGTIGVLGPTRMHYPEALATVAVVSRRLGQRLSEG